jgi:hypothetical protein
MALFARVNWLSRGVLDKSLDRPLPAPVNVEISFSEKLFVVHTVSVRLGCPLNPLAVT